MVNSLYFVRTLEEFTVVVLLELILQYVLWCTFKGVGNGEFPGCQVCCLVTEYTLTRDFRLSVRGGSR